MSKETNIKGQIIDLAENLIMKRGYNGFSYKNIASELNVKTAAIHYHFPSKKDLGVAVIKRAQTRFREWDEKAASEDLSPVDMLNQSLETYFEYLDSEEYVCLGGSLETDIHTLPEEMQDEIRIYVAEILTWLRNLLSRGRAQGVFSFSGPSESKAFFVLSCVQGALQIARVNDKKLFHRTIDTLKAELGL